MLAETVRRAREFFALPVEQKLALSPVAYNAANSYERGSERHCWLDMSSDIETPITQQSSMVHSIGPLSGGGV